MPTTKTSQCGTGCFKRSWNYKSLLQKWYTFRVIVIMSNYDKTVICNPTEMNLEIKRSFSWAPFSLIAWWWDWLVTVVYASADFAMNATSSVHNLGITDIIIPKNLRFDIWTHHGAVFAGLEVLARLVGSHGIQQTLQLQQLAYPWQLVSRPLQLLPLPLLTKLLISLNNQTTKCHTLIEHCEHGNWTGKTCLCERVF